MKKIISLIIAAAMLACLFTTFASAEPAQIAGVSLDAIDGKKTSTLESMVYKVEAEIEDGADLTILGWLLTTASHIDTVQYSIDGGEWTDAVGPYRDRADVGTVLPDLAPCDPTNAGFGTDAEHLSLAKVKDLAIGTYNVKIRAHLADGTDLLFADVALSVVDEIYIPDPTVFEVDAEAEVYRYSSEASLQPGQPYDFKGAASTAFQFKVPEGKKATQFIFYGSPTWGNSGGTGSDCLVKMYKFNTDYATTVAADPIDTVQIYGHKDNQDLIIQFSKSFSAGEYLMVVEANGTNSIGIWRADVGQDTSLIYVNDQPVAEWYAFFAAMVRDDIAPAPQTGDITVAAFAVIAVIALAAIVVLKKRVNG